ncbi:hypothetical protein BDR26DRAFT_872001 [Obelidium mucronatum]|nr:hypothetical protein BDR26DRAFT_872001 [Obelidium mucronatum]
MSLSPSTSPRPRPDPQWGCVTPAQLAQANPRARAFCTDPLCSGSGDSVCPLGSSCNLVDLPQPKCDTGPWMVYFDLQQSIEVQQQLERLKTSLAVRPLSSTTTTTSAASTAAVSKIPATNNVDTSNSGVSVGAIVAISVGVAVVIAVAIYMIVRKFGVKVVVETNHSATRSRSGKETQQLRRVDPPRRDVPTFAERDDFFDDTSIGESTRISVAASELRPFQGDAFLPELAEAEKPPLP